ncbi:hypothetical protein D9615_002184 [Tricholomella constricta]|uniref:Protein kinase domain-containing protein n=1 Tax=Tricholomella constricta TaxID=117010 RepID=A0A8H5HMZ9_9AGAR|nr:hypothetical protein D9615_002184 [Tricholomella constricta]
MILSTGSRVIQRLATARLSPAASLPMAGRLNEELRLVLEHNPQPLIPDPRSSCPPLTSPLSFYDKHLDKRLTLKKVMLFPSFATDLSKAIDRTFMTIREHKLSLPGVACNFPDLEFVQTFLEKGPVKDAESVGRAYQVVTSYFAKVLASMFSLHLNAPSWTSALAFHARPLTRQQEYYALNEDYTLEFSKPYLEPVDVNTMPKAAWTAMNETKQEEVKQARQRFPLLAVWQMFSISCEAEDALKIMDKVTDMDTFQSQTFLTVAPGCFPANVSHPQSPDAISTPWVANVLPLLSKSPTSGRTGPSGIAAAPIRSEALLRRSNRLSTKTAAKAKQVKQLKIVDGVDSSSPSNANSKKEWPNVTIPGKTTMADSPRDLAASILQHAWACAVERDSSFIVFHCGNFERIAFRHRSSQTLFISELIDVTRCKNPGYGEIHTTLFMAIIEDVLDRTRQLVQSEMETKPRNNSGKRKRGAPPPSEGHKRPKTRARLALEAAQVVEHRKKLAVVAEAIAERPLAVLRIHDRHFNSPVPASLLRIDRQATMDDSVFDSKKYFLLTITSKLGAGATGDVHSASLKFQASTGETVLFSDAVVKLAFDSEQRERMRNEFEVYEHLNSSGVEGIPTIFGLFKDVESEALALVMNNVGTSVWKRRPDKRSMSLAISALERVAFIEIMKSIHDAGVRHRDIRPDNLVVNDDGIVSIIDFDRTIMDSSEGSRKRELEHIMELLNGETFTIELGLPSFGTPGDSPI